MPGRYSHLGLNSRLQSERGLSAKRQKMSPLAFSGQFVVQGKNARLSKANLGEFIKFTEGGTAVGNFEAFQSLNLTSEITYKTPKGANRTFGKVSVAVYEGAGTAADDQIYPIKGVNVTLGRYDVMGGENDYVDYNGTSDQWRAMIMDTEGTSSQQVTFVADWLFTDYVADDVT